MTTFNWNIAKLDCFPDHEGQTNVVVSIHWTASAEATASNQRYVAETYGELEVEYVPSVDFVPYDQLTKDQLLEWVWEKVNKEALETGLANEIARKIRPVVVSPDLPWAQGPNV